MGRFCGGLIYLYRFYVLSIEKKEKKKYCFVPAKGTFHGEIKTLALSFALQSMHLTLVFLASSKAE